MKRCFIIVITTILFMPLLVNALINNNDSAEFNINQLFNIISEDGNIVIDNYKIANAILYDENIDLDYNYQYEAMVKLYIDNLPGVKDFYKGHSKEEYDLSILECDLSEQTCFVMIDTNIECAAPKGPLGIANDFEIGETTSVCSDTTKKWIRKYSIEYSLTDDYDLTLFKNIYEGKIIDGDESGDYKKPTYYLFDMQYINALRNYNGFEKIINSYKGLEFFVPKVKLAFERNKGVDFVVLKVTENANTKAALIEQFDIINHRLVFYKGNTVYWSKAVSFAYSNIVLISDKTPKTTDDYIAAASRRIEEYLNDGTEFTITALPPDNEYYYNPVGAFLNGAFKDENEYTTSLVDEEVQMYTIEIGDYTDDFYIVAVPEEKIDELEFGSFESGTGFLAKSNSGDVPLDATLVVEDVTNDIKTKLDNVVMAYDISLQSVVDNQFISYAEDGVKVMIPVEKDFDLTGKSLYYINDDGEKGEKYSSTMETINNQKYISFVTNHFSTYAILLDNVVTPSVEEPVSSENGKEDAKENGKEAPNTGEFAPIIPIAVLLVGGFVIIKKQKRILYKI